MTSSAPILRRARHGLGLLGELVYVVDAFAVTLLVIVVVLAGTNPFESATLSVLIGATVVIAGVHHIWYARNRQQIEHDPVRLHARERRGF